MAFPGSFGRDKDGWLLIAAAGKEGALVGSADLVAGPLGKGDAEKLMDGVADTEPALSAGFANGDVAADPPLIVRLGADNDVASGGAANPPEAFFCSCSLALIFAIASASKSCFSHFENVLNPPLRVGLSIPPWGRGLYADATRRPEDV